MATITIKYTEPVAPEEGKVLPISALFEPTGSYIDSDAYAGTVYDTNVTGNGNYEGLAAYISTITQHPGILLMFKSAVRDGEVTFDESDPTAVEYYKELGTALADQGFVVTAAEAEEAKGN